MPQSRKFKCTECGIRSSFCTITVTDPEGEDLPTLDTLKPDLCPWSGNKDTKPKFDEVE